MVLLLTGVGPVLAAEQHVGRLVANVGPYLMASLDEDIVIVVPAGNKRRILALHDELGRHLHRKLGGGLSQPTRLTNVEVGVAPPRPSVPALRWRRRGRCHRGRAKTSRDACDVEGALTSMNIQRAVLCVVLSAIAVASGCARSDAPKSTVLYVIEHAETDTLQHVGKPDEKDSRGDVLAFFNPLYDESNANKVGTSSGVCFRTAPGSAYDCMWTATVPGGQLTVQGPFYDTKDSTLAITGGTGDYDGASGEMALHARNPQGTEYDFKYTIVK